MASPAGGLRAPARGDMAAVEPGEVRWTRVRVVFGKRGRLRFLGQLDVGRTFDRSLRRTGLPVRFTEGFNPRVRVSFPCACPTGMASSCEIAEVQVRPPAGACAVAEALRDDLPAEFPILAAEEVPEGERLRLLEASYAVVPAAGTDLPTPGRLAGLAAAPSIPAVRRGKPVDLAPFLRGLDAGPGRLRVRIAFLANGATVRPEDFLRALGEDPGRYRAERIGVLVELRRAETTGRGATTGERRYGA